MAGGGGGSHLRLVCGGTCFRAHLVAGRIQFLVGTGDLSFVLAVGQRAPPVPGHGGPSVATCFIRGSGGGAAGKTNVTVKCDAAPGWHPAISVLSSG